MSQLIQNFQSELLQKIQFKASSKVSLDAFLFKAFKFFDLYSNGCLSKTDFFKGIAKCGVVVDPENIDALYQHYAHQDGKVHYQQFIQQLLFREEEIQSNQSRLKQSSHQSIASHHSNLQQTPQIGLTYTEPNKLSPSKNSQQQLAESKINKFYNKCETYADVLAFIKRSIDSGTMGTLLQLAVKLKATDPSKTHLINRRMLNGVTPFLTAEHIDFIFKELSDNQAEIDYSVLVYDLKGQVDQAKAHEIGGVFNYLDNRREGQFPINYLLSSFLSRSQIGAFQRAVNLYCQFQGIDDGVFTEDDFNDFMGFLAFDYASQQLFSKALIRPFYEEDNKSTISNRSNRSRQFQANKSQKSEQHPEPQADFRKNKDSPIQQQNFDEFPEQLTHEIDAKSISRHSKIQAKGIPSSDLKQVESVLLRIKKRLASKGCKGFLLFEKAMKNADLNRDTLLSYEQFKQVIRDQRIDITSTETNALFDLFDEQGTNSLSFPELMVILRGKLPEGRKVLTDKLWYQVHLNQETTNFAKIKKTLNFRNHPDIQTGRRYEEDIWKEIQQTILLIQELNGVPRSDNISRTQFEQFMENVSLSILDDKLFESVLYNFWKLDTSSSILDKYAGSRKLFDGTKNNYLMDHHRYVVQGGSVSQNAPFGTSLEPTSYFTEHHKL